MASAFKDMPGTVCPAPPDEQCIKGDLVMANELVSIILPTYNRAYTIWDSIQSILQQTYKKFELIIVDDASTDNTGEIVGDFRDSRIVYLCHKKNRGAAAARNTGIRAAKGAYIAFQDSDDEWLPQKLEKQMLVFRGAPATVGVVYSDMWRVCGGKKTYWNSPIIRPHEEIVCEQALDRVMGIGIQTAVIKRTCFGRIGVFDERFPRFIDLELFVRLVRYYRFCHINEPLVIFKDTGSGISNNTNALVEAYKLLFQKHDCILHNKAMVARHLFGLGSSMCIAGEPNGGRQYLFRAFRTHPFNIKYGLALCLSLFGARIFNAVIRLRRTL